VGVDELTSYLKGAQTRDEHSIILSSGDMWQGSAESNLTGGIMMTEWMNTAGFVSMTIGNHEYDWGEDKVIANAAAADFPFLAINIFDRSTNQRVSYCDASVMVTRGDLTIGIIGAVGDCYSSISADRVEDIYFKTGSELTALVKAESDRLRSLGADIIVYSLHDGYGSSTSSSSLSVANLSSYYDISLSNGYVDVVFEGHTHQSYAAKDSYGVYHLQGAGENKGISHVEMAVNFVTDKASVTEAAFVSSSVYSSYEDSADVLALFNSYESVLTDAYSVLGENAAYRNSNYICDLVAMLYYELGVEEWGDEYNIFLGGGFIKARSLYNLQAGDVTYADILTIMPFDNKLQLCSIKGRYLKSKFINTSNSDYHIYYGEYGASLIDSIDDNATYYIIVDSYTALYAPNNLTVVADYPDDNLYARDLLADYIRSGGLE
jgi:2',3'-cyclic-nucleotide 2'-phosphodiesterase/3'-nucleotidase